MCFASINRTNLDLLRERALDIGWGWDGYKCPVRSKTTKKRVMPQPSAWL